MRVRASRPGVPQLVHGHGARGSAGSPGPGRGHRPLSHLQCRSARGQRPQEDWDVATAAACDGDVRPARGTPQMFPADFPVGLGVASSASPFLPPALWLPAVAELLRPPSPPGRAWPLRCLSQHPTWGSMTRGGGHRVPGVSPRHAPRAVPSARRSERPHAANAPPPQGPARALHPQEGAQAPVPPWPAEPAFGLLGSC